MRPCPYKSFQSFRIEQRVAEFDIRLNKIIPRRKIEI